LAEEVLAGAVGGFQEAHVLGHAEDRDADLLEHRRAAQGDGDRRGLRGGHDDRAAEGHRLGDGKLGVARAGGQVDQQHVEFAPPDVRGELRDGLHDHRAAPDDRGVGVDEEAHRHHLHAEILQGEEGVAFQEGATVDADHQRDRRAVDIAVHQADLARAALVGEGPGQRAGEVDREGGLTHAAFAAGDRDDVLHLPHAGVGRELGGGRRGSGGGRGSLRHGHRDGDLGLLGAKGLQGGLDLGIELLGDFRVGARDGQADAHLAVEGDLDALDQAEGDDVAAVPGVADPTEGLSSDISGIELPAQPRSNC